MAKQKEKTYIECECGARIFGFSEHHTKENLKIHKFSRKHKELMELKKKWQKGNNHKNNK